jgi:alpha-mannosidase
MPYAKAQMQSQIKRAISQVKKGIYTIVGELAMTAWVTPEPVPYRDRMTGTPKTLRIGERWGQLWDCAWFHFSGEIPPSAAGQKVVLLIDVGGEACVVDRDGTPVQGLTNANSEFDRSLGTPGKRVVFFTDRARAGEPVDLWADAGTNDLFGKYRDNGTVQAAYIAIGDDSLKALYYDLEYLQDLMSSLPETSARHDAILFALYDAVLLLKQLTPPEVRAARMTVAPELAKKAADPSLRISALGHSHIDLAWLWPLRETVRKGARTFATALMMMDRYPDFVFGASQPQLYQWIKSFYPALYEKINPRVREGRWEPLGAMWVEADTNIPGGESLVGRSFTGNGSFATNSTTIPISSGCRTVSALTPRCRNCFKKRGLTFLRPSNFPGICLINIRITALSGRESTAVRSWPICRRKEPTTAPPRPGPSSKPNPITATRETPIIAW